jgi:anaerobic selenocysteine-containing dehydrogenase
VNWDYLDWATFMGFLAGRTHHPPAIRTPAEAPLAGFGAVTPPANTAAGSKPISIPSPSGMRRSRRAGERHEFPMHAIAAAHGRITWGSQNAWLRQILGRNWLYMNKDRAASLGIAEGDWVTVTSHHGQIKSQAKLMSGVNPDTVWTWNAIGKRSGTWGLSADAPEAKKGFLLNHLISDLLPEREGGYRFSNSDPVTGQAAWYDAVR